MIRIALMLACFVLQACAETDTNYRQYYIRYVTVGANEAVTIQQPAIGARELRFKGAIVTAATSDCTGGLEKNGTAATATEVDLSKLDTKADAAKAKAYTASNVGNGTETIHSGYKFTAGEPSGISEAGLSLAAGGGQRNFTLRTTCAAGTEITIFVSERP
jgi:hypothetical protein